MGITAKLDSSGACIITVELGEHDECKHALIFEECHGVMEVRHVADLHGNFESPLMRLWTAGVSPWQNVRDVRAIMRKVSRWNELFAVAKDLGWPFTCRHMVGLIKE